MREITIIIDILDQVIGELDAQKRAISERISMGGASSFEEYKASCGKISGISSAQDTINEMIGRIEKERNNV